MPTFSIAKAQAGGRNGAGGEQTASPAGGLALRQLWAKLAGGRWTSLAVVPTGGLQSMPFAAALVEAAGQCGARAVTVDATKCDLGGAARVLQELAAQRPEGVRVVAAVDSVVLSLAAVQVSLAADAVLVIVSYGDADLESVRATIDTVGRDRIQGCVAFRAR